MPAASFDVLEITDRDRQRLPGVEPLVRTRADLRLRVLRMQGTVLTGDRWPLVEQWVAKSLVSFQGVSRCEDLCEFLGLERDYLDQGIQELVASGQVVDSTAGLSAKPSLRVEVEKGSFRRSKPVECHVLWNEATGEMFLPATGSELDDARVVADRALSEDLRKDAERLVTSAKGEWDGQAVQDITVAEQLELCCGVDIIGFLDSGVSSWGWEIFDENGDEPRMDLRKNCADIGIVEFLRVAVADAVGGVEEEEPELEVPEWVGSAGSLPAVATVQMDSPSAQKRLIELIDGAQQEILLSFPWVKAPAVRRLQLLERLQAAVNRGVAIVLCYGIDEVEARENSHVDVLEQLSRIKGDYGRPGVAVRWLGRFHTKETFVDRAHYLFGSHNLLSYHDAGDDSGGGIRREETMWIREPAVIERAFDRFAEYFRQRCTDGLASLRRKSFRSSDAWIDAWQADLQLGLQPEDFQRALSACPSSDVEMITAVKLALLGIDAMVDQSHRERAAAQLGEWLGERVERSKDAEQLRGKIGRALATSGEGRPRFILALQTVNNAVGMR